MSIICFFRFKSGGKIVIIIRESNPPHFRMQIGLTVMQWGNNKS